MPLCKQQSFSVPCMLAPKDRQANTVEQALRGPPFFAGKDLVLIWGSHVPLSCSLRRS